MKQAITEYKQAIIIGASPMGSEESALLKLLKWAGYGEQAEHCSRDCDTCHTGCSAKIKNKDIYVVVADGGLKFLLKNGMLPDFFVGDLDSVELEGALTEIRIWRWRLPRLTKKATGTFCCTADAAVRGFRTHLQISR